MNTREKKLCNICGKNVSKLKQHIENKHKCVAEEIINEMIVGQKRLKRQGKTTAYVKCPVRIYDKECGTMIKEVEFHRHLKRSHKISIKSDAGKEFASLSKLGRVIRAPILEVDSEAQTIEVESEDSIIDVEVAEQNFENISANETATLDQTPNLIIKDKMARYTTYLQKGGMLKGKTCKTYAQTVLGWGGESGDLKSLEDGNEILMNCFLCQSKSTFLRKYWALKYFVEFCNLNEDLNLQEIHELEYFTE